MTDYEPDGGLTFDELAAVIRGAGHSRPPQCSDGVGSRSSSPKVAHLAATVTLADGSLIDIEVIGVDGAGMLGRFDLSETLVDGPPPNEFAAASRNPSGHRVVTLSMQGFITGTCTARPSEGSVGAGSHTDA